MEHAIITTLRNMAAEALERALQNVFFDAYCCEGEEIIIRHDTPCGSIELYGELNEPWQVYVENSSLHDLPTLCCAIKDALPPYEFDVDSAREEDERDRLEMERQNYELVCSGYFL